MVERRPKGRAKRFLRWLQRYRLWLLLAAASVAVGLLAVWVVSRGEQWYQSLDAVVLLFTLLGWVFLAWQAWRAGKQSSDPFKLCTTAKAVKESLLVKDEFESLGMRVNYLPRRSSPIDEVLRRPLTAEKRNVLVVGSDCSGKTRELLEVANRHLLGAAVALVYSSDELLGHMSLDLRVPRRRVLLIIDDIHDCCRRYRPSRLPYTDSSTHFMDELERIVRKRLKRRLHKNVSVVAACAFYPSALDDIEWNDHKFWKGFERISLGFLSRPEMECIVDELAAEASLDLSDSQRRTIIENSTGVFIPVLELFNRVAGSSRLREDDWNWYVERLQDYWKATRDSLAQEIPASEVVFQAIDILQQLRIDLLEELVVDVALALNQCSEEQYSEEQVREAVAHLKVFALPASERQGQIHVFRGQADLGYVPESGDEFRALASALAKHWVAIGPETLFDTALELASNYSRIGAAIDLWYSVLDRPLLAPAARFNIGVGIERDGDELQATMHLAEAIADSPELAVSLIQDAGYVTRSEVESLRLMPIGSVSSYVAEAVSHLCDRLLESEQVSPLHREPLLRLSAKGVEYAPNEVKVRLARCRVLDILAIHPDVIDELEQLVDVLLDPDSIPSASFLWEAACIRHKWAEETAEIRFQESFRERRYAAQGDLENARRELQFLRTVLMKEQAKEEHREVITEKKWEGVDLDELPLADAPQVDWFRGEVEEAEEKVRAAEQRLPELAVDVQERDILGREEYKWALVWAEKAREIDPTIGNEGFIAHLRCLSQGVT